MTAHQRNALAALLAQVVEKRYPGQPFSEIQREDWIRAALEGDPVVYLEAAWEWWTDHAEGRFQPSPGRLKLVAKAWPIDSRPYVHLSNALDADAAGKVSPGLEALIGRMGRGLFDEARAGILPSHERAWLDANLAHRRYVWAKERMERRGTPSFNPSEAKGLGLPEWGRLAEALAQPSTHAGRVELGVAHDLAARKLTR